MLFKLVGLAIYFTAEWFYTDNRKMVKLLGCIISGAVDFWTTKNLSGRRLVGLMWKRVENAPPAKEWIFVCRTDESRNNSRNTIFFWGSMVSSVLFWMIFMIYNLITLSFEVKKV